MKRHLHCPLHHASAVMNSKPLNNSLRLSHATDLHVRAAAINLWRMIFVTHLNAPLNALIIGESIYGSTPVRRR